MVGSETKNRIRRVISAGSGSVSRGESHIGMSARRDRALVQNRIVDVYVCSCP